MVGNARGSANTTRASVFVYNHAYGVLAGEAGRFSLVGNYTTTFEAVHTVNSLSGVTHRCAGIAQLVERNLAKVEVASSNLVSRSSQFKKGKHKLPFISPGSPSAR